jgi:hypothetical protein
MAAGDGMYHFIIYPSGAVLPHWLFLEELKAK